MAGPRSSAAGLPDFRHIQRLLDEALGRHRAGDLLAAEASYKHLLTLDPRHVDALHFLGVVHLQRGEFAASEALVRKALAQNPHLAAAHSNLGAALCGQGKLDEAVTHYERAIALEPNFADAHSNLGIALQAQGRDADAIARFRQALTINPRLLQAHKNLGAALQVVGRLDEAIACHRQALALNPNDAEALNNLGVSLRDRGELDQAIACFRRAVALRPDYAHAHDNHLYALNDHGTLSANEIFEAHRNWGAAFEGTVHQDRAAFGNAPEPERRLRVGFVSPDFRTHSVAFFFEPLLGAFDGRAVEVFCYAQVPQPDRVTERIAASADGWRPIVGLTDDEAAALVRNDRIDLLVDLAGHTAGNRLGIFARHAAPVQLTWLGYPNTSGLRAIDYRITDAVADPEGEADCLHTESLQRLKGGFLCYRPDPEVEGAPIDTAPRAGAPTYGSFNNLSKVTPEVVSLWARLLLAVPEARLLLKSRQLADEATGDRYRALFAGHGIAPERVELLATVPSLADHLALYGRVDVALDPFPYNGTTTTCEALWMGVPVVTLRGDRHAARVGTSLLTTLGLEALIANSPAEYVERAGSLIQDAGRLGAFRASLRDLMRRSSLCDAAGHARAMEKAFRAAWRKWCAAHAQAEPVPLHHS